MTGQVANFPTFIVLKLKVEKLMGGGREKKESFGSSSQTGLTTLLSKIGKLAPKGCQTIPYTLFRVEILYMCSIYNIIENVEFIVKLPFGTFLHMLRRKFFTNVI